jgi:dolichyl-phosphate-mannose--protein O-mannosyl transferase
MRDVFSKTAAVLLSRKRSVFATANNRLYFLQFPRPLPRITRADLLIILALSFVAFVERTHQLWFPPERAFDEVYFGDFASRYINGTFFYDIHPPLAKFMTALLSYLGGYRGTIAFNGTTVTTYPSIEYHHMRSVCAVASSAVAPLSFVAVRNFGFSRMTALATAVLFLTDSALNVEGRFVLTDGFLHSFVVLAIGSVPNADRYREFSARWFGSVALSSLCLAFAISVKQTAYSLFAFFAFHHAVAAVRGHFPSLWRIVMAFSARVAVLIAVALPFHWVMYALHFVVLPFHGTGDALLPEWWRQQLAEPGAPRCSLADGQGARLWAKVAYYYRTLHENNMRLNATHPAGSEWYEWPFLTGHTVGFWGSSNKKITLIGNPLLWIPLAWFVIAASTVVLPYLAITGRLTDKLVDVTGFVFGYWASLLPFALVPRTLHLYHYLVPLIFLIMAFPTFCEAVVHPWPRGFALVITVTTAIVGFVLFVPIQYGISTEDPGWMIWRHYS